MPGISRGMKQDIASLVALDPAGSETNDLLKLKMLVLQAGMYGTASLSRFCRRKIRAVPG